MAHFVQQDPQNEQLLNNIFANNIDTVIESLGGLCNIIQLCLTNPTASQSIDSDKFESFVRILTDNGISYQNRLDTSENNEITIVYDNSNDKPQIPPSPTMVMSDSDMNDRQSGVERVHSIDTADTNNNNSNQNQCHQTTNCTNLNIKNLDEYYQSRLIINAKAEDKIMFQLFGQAGYVQQLVTNEIFLYLVITIVGVGFMIAFTVLILDGQNMAYYTTLTVVFTTAFILQVIILLNSHRMLYSLTFNTFDFWFVLWHAANVIVSRTALGIYNQQFVWYSISRTVTAFSTAICLVCFDALDVSKQFKAIARTMVFIYFSFLVLSFYFSGEDVEWNPFESYNIKQSNISFKSVYLSSMTNIILFAFKPLYKDIYRVLRKRLYAAFNVLDNNAVGTTQQVNDKNYQRCEFLYTRPYVRWEI